MPADAGYKAGFSFHRQQASESISFRVAALPQKNNCFVMKAKRESYDVNQRDLPDGRYSAGICKAYSVCPGALYSGVGIHYWLLASDRVCFAIGGAPTSRVNPNRCAGGLQPDVATGALKVR